MFVPWYYTVRVCMNYSMKINYLITTQRQRCYVGIVMIVLWMLNRRANMIET